VNNNRIKEVMEPIINEIKEQFVKVAESEIKASYLLSDLSNKINLLLPYYNNALTFYLNDLYSFNINEQSVVIFGHDLGGYFGLDKKDGTIGHLIEDNGKLKVRFCNSDINQFICFNNLFLCMVNKIINNEISDNSFDSFIETLETFFSDINKQALLKEDNYWSERVYELSDGFFPLGDERIKFYENLKRSASDENA